MTFRKVAILVMLLSVWGGTMLFASTSSQKVQIFIDGSEQEESGLLIEGKTYLPLRQLAGSLQAILEWDGSNKRATLYKPNVHMFLYQGNSTFGQVDKGFPAQFKVFAQIDNLKADVDAVKVSIFDPNGKERVIQSKSVSTKNDNFWFVTEEIDYKFESSGKYIVRFFMKLSSNDEWISVSEKIITSNTSK